MCIKTEGILFFKSYPCCVIAVEDDDGGGGGNCIHKTRQVQCNVQDEEIKR